jgi:hypothetical protein
MLAKVIFLVRVLVKARFLDSKQQTYDVGEVSGNSSGNFQTFFISTSEGFKWLETIGNGQKPLNRAFGAQFEVVRL